MNYKQILIDLVEESNKWIRINDPQLPLLTVTFDYYNGLRDSIYSSETILKLTLKKGNFKTYSQSYLSATVVELPEEVKNNIWEKLSKECLIVTMVQKSAFQQEVESGNIKLIQYI